MAVRDYYRLTKPGIIRGNFVHILAGVIFAYAYGLTWEPVLGVLIGTSFIIASACVVNNYTDRGIDARMKRTRTRASVTGAVTLQSAMIFAALLFMAGFIVLLTMTNLLVAILGLIAYVFYTLFYAIAKRKTLHSTLVGAIPGAIPAMAGYVAISGQVDLAAWLLFLLVLVWQMPHFYAISIFRREEYKEAGLPVLGVVKSFKEVRRQMGLYIILYLALITLMITSRSINVLGGTVLMVGGLYWLYVFQRVPTNQVKWARSVFGTSLLLTICLLTAVVLNAFTPGLTALQ